jgi:hypothetical protein
MQIAMKVEQRQDSLGDYFQAKAIYPDFYFRHQRGTEARISKVNGEQKASPRKMVRSENSRSLSQMV